MTEKTWLSERVVKSARKFSPILAAALKKNNEIVLYSSPESNDNICIYKDTGLTFLSNLEEFKELYTAVNGWSNPAGCFCGAVYVWYDKLIEYCHYKTGEYDIEYGINLTEREIRDFDKVVEYLEYMERENTLFLNPAKYENMVDTLICNEIDRLVLIYGKEKREKIADYLAYNGYEEEGAYCYNERELESIICYN